MRFEIKRSTEVVLTLESHEAEMLYVLFGNMSKQEITKILSEAEGTCVDSGEVYKITERIYDELDKEGF